MMERTTQNGTGKFTIPFIISIAIHILLVLLIISFSYRYHLVMKKKSDSEAAPDAGIYSVTISQENEILQNESNRDYRENIKNRGSGPYGLNDEAGRELLECARSGISVTPDNFLEYDRIRSIRKGLNLKHKEKIDRGLSFLKDIEHFSTGIDHKFKTDFQECYENICSIINLPENKHVSLEDKADIFTATVLDYLNGKRAVRTWRTLWLVAKPAAMKDKTELVRLLRRLQNYFLEGEGAGYEHMRRSINSIIPIIPIELKFPVIRNK